MLYRMIEVSGGNSRPQSVKLQVRCSRRLNRSFLGVFTTCFVCWFGWSIRTWMGSLNRGDVVLLKVTFFFTTDVSARWLTIQPSSFSAVVRSPCLGMYW